MVDDRFAKNQRYMNSLSRWVRSDVVHYSNCNQMLSTLESFKNEMIASDKENDRLAALYNSAEVNQQVPSILRFTNQGSKASRGGKSQKNWKSTKRKPLSISYDTDSSSDAPSPMYRGSELNASSASKLRKQIESVNKNSRPNVGTFGGPKNRSEFFSKNSKNKRTPRDNTPSTYKEIHAPEAIGVNDVSPSSRLASLARFRVPKEDLVKADICDSSYSFHENVRSVPESPERSEPPSSIMYADAPTIPSDIRIGKSIPSDYNLGPAYRSILPFTPSSTFTAPLSDITTSTPCSVSNTKTMKKKFKFSPINANKPCVPSSDDLCINGDDQSEKKIVDQALIKPEQRKTDSYSANLTSEQNISQNNSVSSLIKPLQRTNHSTAKSTRYVLGKYKVKYDSDSDDDFQ